MERLMYDVYVAEATMENDYQNFDTPPEKKESYIRRVFKAHKTTQDQWDTSLSWYSDRIDIYLKMNDSVKARIQRDRQKVDAEVARQYALQNTDPAYLSPSFIPSFYQFSKQTWVEASGSNLILLKFSPKLPKIISRSHLVLQASLLCSLPLLHRL